MHTVCMLESLLVTAVTVAAQVVFLDRNNSCFHAVVARASCCELDPSEFQDVGVETKADM